MDGVPHLTHELLLEHHAFVFRLAKSIVGDDDVAHDVVNDSFLTALRRPPKHGGIQAWLVAVVRSRAMDRVRSERSRAERERAAARAESTDDDTRAREALELRQNVVQAVLALPEPYRAVVIARYDEGLSPAAIARRQETPETTVRAHLKKAHEMLRAKLGRAYGEGEDGWRRKLLVFADLTARTIPSSAARTAASKTVAKTATTAASQTTANSATWTAPLVLGTAAALVVVTSTWYLTSDRGPAHEVLASVDTDDALARTPIAAVIPSGDADERKAIAPQFAAVSAVNSRVDALDLGELLAYSRKIKREILRRQSPPSLQVVDPRFPNQRDAGVVRLGLKPSFMSNRDLPGSKGEGLCYSFTSHAYGFDKHPELAAFVDSLNVSLYPGVENWFLDLRDVDPTAVRASSASSPFPRDAGFTAQWEAMFAPMSEGALLSRRPLAMLWAEALDHAIDDGTIADEDRSKLTLFQSRLNLKAGATCLMRTFARDEFDVLVLITVLETNEDSCVLGWRLLRDASPPHDLLAATMEDIAVDTTPQGQYLRSLEPKALEDELNAVLDRSAGLLFARHAPDTEARYGALRPLPDSDLKRVLAVGSEWHELLPIDSLRSNQLKFVKPSNMDTDLYPIQLEGSERGYELTAIDACAIVHLGSVPLESVTLELLSSSSEPAARFVTEESPAEATIAHTPRTGAEDPKLRLDEGRRLYFARAIELGASRTVVPMLGHTYLARAGTCASDDTLAAFTVAQVDRYGVVIAWHVLRPPVPPPDAPR